MKTVAMTAFPRLETWGSSRRGLSEADNGASGVQSRRDFVWISPRFLTQGSRRSRVVNAFLQTSAPQYK
jgi:hypothetical protein